MTMVSNTKIEKYAPIDKTQEDKEVNAWGQGEEEAAGGFGM